MNEEPLYPGQIKIKKLDRRGIPLTWGEFFMSLVICGFIFLGLGYYWNYKHTASFIDHSYEILNGKFTKLVHEFAQLETDIGILQGKNIRKQNKRVTP